MCDALSLQQAEPGAGKGVIMGICLLPTSRAGQTILNELQTILNNKISSITQDLVKR